jgi:hypothetical protein
MTGLNLLGGFGDKLRDFTLTASVGSRFVRETATIPPLVVMTV